MLPTVFVAESISNRNTSKKKKFINYNKGIKSILVSGYNPNVSIVCLDLKLDNNIDFVKLSLSTAKFPSNLKCAIVQLLLKKTSLDSGILKNNFPVSNLSFVSNLIKKFSTAFLLTIRKQQFHGSIPVCPQKKTQQ